jgi:Mn2+/Fe2+ NRAMP family transporter
VQRGCRSSVAGLTAAQAGQETSGSASSPLERLSRLSSPGAFSWGSGVGKPFRDAPTFFGIYTFVLALGALVVLIPGIDLLPMIVGSQYLQGLLLPVVLVFMVCWSTTSG